MAMQEDDYLYEQLEENWEREGRPCFKCSTQMIYDSQRSNQVTRPIPGNVYGTKEPLYRYYKCPKCSYQK
jgi:DNA-directed RNA polymerase subunit RPC12/RpoP